MSDPATEKATGGGSAPPAHTRTIVLGLGAAALLLAGFFAFGRMDGATSSTTAIQDLDPVMAEFERDLKGLLTQVEAWSKAAETTTAAPQPKE